MSKDTPDNNSRSNGIATQTVEAMRWKKDAGHGPFNKALDEILEVKDSGIPALSSTAERAIKALINLNSLSQKELDEAVARRKRKSGS